MRAEVVSFSDEPLILVDSNDEEVGFLDKEGLATNRHGKLHRAFSVFIFNSEGKLCSSSEALRSVSGAVIGQIPVAVILDRARPLHLRR